MDANGLQEMRGSLKRELEEESANNNPMSTDRIAWLGDRLAE